MKRIIAAAVLMVFIISSYLGGYFYIKKTCEDTEKIVKECVSAYEEQKNIKLYTTKLENYWSSKEKILSVVTNHNAIDEVEHAIESLTVHSKYPQNQMFYEYSSTLEILLHQIMEDTAFGMHSIM